jgi:hypothetical protein
MLRNNAPAPQVECHATPCQISSVQGAIWQPAALLRASVTVYTQEHPVHIASGTPPGALLMYTVGWTLLVCNKHDAVAGHNPLLLCQLLVD